MSKNNINTKITIDVEANVSKLENLKKSMSSVTEESGSIGKNAEKIVDYIDDMIAKLKTSGKSMPLGQLEKIIANLRTIENYSEKIVESANKPVISEKERAKELERINKELKKEQAALDALIAKQAKMPKNEKQFKEQKTRELLTRDKFKTGSGVNRRSIIDPNTRDINAAIEDYKKNKPAIETDKQWVANKERLRKLQEESNTLWAEEQNQLKQINHDIKTQTKEVRDLSVEYDKIKNTPTNPVSPLASGIGETGSATTGSMAKDLEKVAEAAKTTGNAEVELTQTTNKTNQSFQGLGKTLAKTHIGYQLLKRVFHESLKTVQDMDRALTDMTVVTGMSREEARSYVSTMQNIASATSTAMTEVANLTTEYLRQGRTMKDALELARETAKAAKISGLSTSDTIQYITAAINGFNLAATQASHVSDVFSKLAALSATTYENLAIALSKVSAQANLAGVSLEYTSALLAKGMETTQEAPESIGTALKTVIARMRELKDYGSTLEDGANVNKVEAALKATGMQLRDVNGEFRNLEDVFNELGPQWDTLNKMQQQAIAQAVAGTRQQSRFVAIMQDWQRTAELAAEAQDGAGASAAQYVQYAQGMEAAMTNLKNSWQKFIDSVTSSKVLIQGVNLVTKLVEGLNNVLPIGGEFSKVTGTILITVAVFKETVGKLIESFRTWLNTTQEINATLKEMRDAQIQTETPEQQKINIIKEQNRLYDEQAKKIKDISEKQLKNKQVLSEETDIQKLDKKESALKTEQESLENKINNELDDEKVIEYQQRLADIQVELEEIVKEKEQAVSIDPKTVYAYDDAIREGNTLQEEKNRLTQEQVQLVTEENSIFNLLSEENQAELQQMYDKNQAQIDYNNELIKELELKDEIRKQSGQEAIYGAQIAKLNAKNAKLTAKNNKLLNQASNSLGKETKLWNGLVNKLSRKFGVNLNNIKKQYGPIVKSAQSLWKGETLHNISIDEQIKLQKNVLGKMKEGTGEYKAQQIKVSQLEQLKQTGAQKDMVSQQQLNALGLTEFDIKATTLAEEQKQTFEEEKQKLLDEGKEPALASELAYTKAVGAAEKENTKEKEKGFFAGLKNAATAMMESAAKIPVVGWVIAAAIAATVLGIGIAASASANSSENTDKKTGNQIAEGQAKAYNLKKDISQNTKYADEYNTLLNKNRTTEEQERFEELTESIQDVNESFKGLEGQALLQALQAKNVLDKSNYNALINKNAELALSIKDLDNSVVGQNAITSYLTNSQKELIQSNEKLIDANEAVVAAVTSKSSNIAGDIGHNAQAIFEQQNDGEYGDLGADKDFVFADYMANIGAGLALGAIGSPIVGTVGALIGSIVLDVENAKKRYDQIENRQKLLHDLNVKVVDFTATMETTIADNNEALKQSDGKASAFIDNLKTYHEEYNEFVKKFGTEAAKSLDATYTTFGYIDKMISDKQRNINDETANTIKRLLELQVLTDNAIEKLANLMSDIDGTINSAQEAAKLWNDDGQWKKYYDTLIRDKDNSITENSTAQEIYDEIMSHAKYNKDGSIMHDEQGKVVLDDSGWKGGATDKHINLVFEQMGAIIASGFGDLTMQAVNEMSKALAGVKTEDGASLQDNFKNFIDNLGQFYKDAEKENITNADRVANFYDTVKNSDFLNQVKSLEEAASKIEETDPQAARELRASAKEWRAKIETTIQEMSGLMDSGKMSDTFTSMISSLEKAEDLKGKLGETLDAEDIQTIDNIARTVVDTKNLNYKEVYEAIQHGTAQGLDFLDNYNDILRESTINMFDLSATNAEYLLKKATEDEKAIYESALYMARHYQEQVANYGNVTKEELQALQKENLKHALDTLSETETIESMKAQLEVIDKLQNKFIKDEIEKSYEDMSKKIGNKTIEQMKSYIKYTNGVIEITEKAHEELTTEEYNMLKTFQEDYQDLAEEQKEYTDRRTELTTQMLETQIDVENEYYDAYCERLDKENEALQNALDKRKEMYEKYFDALEKEETEEDYETTKAKLENVISLLMSSNDAGSLQKLKDYQVQLQELEEQRNQELRDARREAVLADLDNMGTTADEAAEQQKQNKQTIIEALKTWTDEQLTDLLIDSRGNLSDAENQQIRNNSINSLSNFRESVPNNANGGLVDYTGPAWVDGTSTRPEAFLSADQTAIFASLANSLGQAVRYGSSIQSTSNDTSMVTIESLNINLNGTVDSGNVQQSGYDLADAFMEGLRRTGINLNKKA